MNDTTEPASAAAAVATRYEVSALPWGHRDRRRFAALVEHAGRDQWAVRDPSGGCFDALGEWADEPMPSDRSEEWLARHRFPLAEALQIADRIAARGLTT